MKHLSRERREKQPDSLVRRANGEELNRTVYSPRRCLTGSWDRMISSDDPRSYKAP